MTSTAVTSIRHPIVEFTDRLRRRLGDLADTPAWSMTPDEQRAVLIDLHQAAGQLEELRLRVLAAGDRNDIAADSAAASTGAWLAHATTQPRGKAHADVKLALALDDTYPATRDALAAGLVDGEQARVIIAAVDTVRRHAVDAVTADPSIPERAEKHLLTLAGDHDAKALTALARHVVEVLDPDAADLQLGNKLHAQEAAAARTTYLEIFDNADGTHSGRFRIQTLHAAMFRKALEAFTNPTHTHRHPHDTTGPTAGETTAGSAADTPAGSAAGTATGTAAGETTGGSGRLRRRPRPELLGEAFGELLERLDPTTLPHSGGQNATVVITLDYDKLLTGLGTAHLDTGEPISAGLARRLACHAGVIPTVIRRLLDGRSIVLDMGRKRRLFTEHQRIALTIEQRGCTTENCDRPAAWCHAHHDIAWSHGGTTDLNNGRLLCPFHHAKAHTTSYHIHHLTKGTIQFHRRT